MASASSSAVARVFLKVQWAKVSGESRPDVWTVIRNVRVTGPDDLQSAVLKDAGEAAYLDGVPDAHWRVQYEQQGETCVEALYSMPLEELLALPSPVHIIVKANVPTAITPPVHSPVWNLRLINSTRIYRILQDARAVRTLASMQHHEKYGAPFKAFWKLHHYQLKTMPELHIHHIENEESINKALQVYEDIANLVKTLMRNIESVFYPGQQFYPSGGVTLCNKAGTDGLRPDIVWCGYHSEPDKVKLHEDAHLLMEYKADLLRQDWRNAGLGHLANGFAAARKARNAEELHLPCALWSSSHVICVVMYTNRDIGVITHSEQPLTYAREEHQGLHLVDPEAQGFKELTFCCFVATYNLFHLRAASSFECMRPGDHEAVSVRSATQQYAFQIVAQLGKPRPYGVVCAVQPTAGTQVRVASATGMYVVKIGPRPNDLAAATRLGLDLPPWTQVQREASILARLGRHGLTSLPELVDHGMLEPSPTSAPDLAGSCAIITPLQGRPLVPATGAPSPLMPAAVQRLAADVLEGLLFVHAQGVWHNDVAPFNIGVIDAGSDAPERYYLFDFGAASCPALHLYDQPMAHEMYASTSWLVTGQVSSALGDIESLIYTCMALSSPGEETMEGYDHAEPAALPWEEAQLSGDMLRVLLLRADLHAQPEQNPVLRSWPRPLLEFAKGVFRCVYTEAPPPPMEVWLSLLRGPS